MSTWPAFGALGRSVTSSPMLISHELAAGQTRLNLQQLGLSLPGLIECPKCGDWVTFMVLVRYQYSQEPSQPQTLVSAMIDARDLIEEIIKVQTTKLSASTNIGDTAMDHDAICHRYETSSGEYTHASSVLGAPSHMHVLHVDTSSGDHTCQHLLLQHGTPDTP